jgi:transposase
LDYVASAQAHRLVAQKKSVAAVERDPWQRAAFALAREALDAAQVVVIDEFGSNLDMVRTHAWAPRGQRAQVAIPRNTPPNTTTIAALTPNGMGPAMVVRGGVDQVTFATYIEQVLGPTLVPGQVVVLDNLSAHTHPRIAELVAARGCTMLYLPSYSPDYSPIELAFAKIKTQLRQAAARTAEALLTAIATALAAITASDALAFFRHCGFRFRPELDQWFCTSL